jgi:EAL and modified HD-GYP domain-containing signal transduction protein
MHDQVLMARQPIYDSNINIVAYELLFRQLNTDCANVIDGDAATSEILIDAFTQWDIREIVGNTRAFVNFTRALIGKPLPFDKQHLVIEVLEDVPIDDQLVHDLRTLAKEGYTIALDDFVNSDKAAQILPFADIVKIDLLQLTRKELEEHVKLLKPYKAKLLAEKVETHEEFAACKALGFDFFQGYFLCKPEVISNKKVPASKLAVLDLVQKLQDPNIEMQTLENVISSDPVLSFKTLKLVNAASYAKVAKIESIGRAISYLGINTLRSLASLLALSNLSDKPNALKDHSCLRAKICELIGARISPPDASSYFSVGLLSTLDAYFDKTLAETVQLLTLHDDVEGALIRREGPLGKALDTACHLQAAELADIDWQYLAQYQIGPEQLNEIHHASINWYQGIRTATL